MTLPPFMLNKGYRDPLFPFGRVKSIDLTWNGQLLMHWCVDPTCWKCKRQHDIMRANFAIAEFALNDGSTYSYSLDADDLKGTVRAAFMNVDGDA